jgi:hypothetical protein
MTFAWSALAAERQHEARRVVGALLAAVEDLIEAGAVLRGVAYQEVTGANYVV